MIDRSKGKTTPQVVVAAHRVQIGPKLLAKGDRVSLELTESQVANLKASGHEVNTPEEREALDAIEQEYQEARAALDAKARALEAELDSKKPGALPADPDDGKPDDGKPDDGKPDDGKPDDGKPDGGKSSRGKGGK